MQRVFVKIWKVYAGVEVKFLIRLKHKERECYKRQLLYRELHYKLIRSSWDSPNNSTVCSDSSLGHESVDALLSCVIRGCERRLSTAEGVLSNTVLFQQSIFN